MGANRHHREPSSAAKKARGVEMLALGRSVVEVAEALGVARKTVDNWRSVHGDTILEAADVRLAGVIEAVADGAAKARALLVAAAPRAAETALLVLDAEEGDPQMLAVRLRAAALVLDRGGVPVLTKVEHSGEAVSDATLERLKAALAAARKP